MRVPPIVFAALAVAGCSSTASADDPTVNGRTFVSVAVDGDQIPGGGPLEVGFDGDRISAYAGCNRGSGEVDLADGRLVIGELATTMMACPPPLGDADAWMTQLLEARPSWTLTGDTLTLSTVTATVTLRDKKAADPDRPLTGTTWLVNSLVSDQAVSTSVALERARPTLYIAPDGAVTGWTGCNQITGHADVAESPAIIEFGPLAGEGRACPEGLGDIQQAVLNVLSGRVRSTIDADELRLTGDDGYGLVLRAVAGR